MPADFSQYVNLRIHDVEAASLYRQMIEVARTVMPEFNLRRGTVEDSIFQSMAYTASIATNAINRVPDGIMQGIVSLFGFSRNFGTRAVITATVTLYGTSGGVIPVGTQFRYRYTDAANGTFTDFLFVASEDTVIPASATPTGTITLTCDSFGELPAPAIGANLFPISVDSDIDTAVVLTFANGTNALTDSEYLDSAKTFLESISTTYVTAKQLEAAILSYFPYVSRCKVFDLMDLSADRGVSVFLPDTSKNVSSSAYKGNIAIFVYGFGRTITASELSSIQSFAATSSMAGLDIEVANFQTVTPTISITAAYDSSFGQASTIEVIKRSLAEYLSPEYFPYDEISISSPRLRSTVLATRLFTTVPGLLSVDTLTISPPSDITYTITAATNTAGQDAVVTTSATHNLAVGQRVRLTDATYTNASIAVKSVPSATTFTIETNYSTAVTSASNMYRYFHETSGSQATLNFLNRGVLPNVSVDNISVTLSAETL